MELTDKEKSIVLSTMLFGLSEGYYTYYREFGITSKEMEQIFTKMGMNTEKFNEMAKTFNYDITKCKVGG